MKRKSLVAAWFLLFVLPLVAESQTEISFLNSDQMVTFEKSDKLLRQLGFEDYAKAAQKTLDEEGSVSEVSALALKKNSMLFKDLEGSRKLANLVPIILDRALQKNELQNVVFGLTQIIIQQLIPFPLFSQNLVKKEQQLEIYLAPIKSAVEKRENFAAIEASHRFDIEKLNLIKAFRQLTEVNSNQIQEFEDYLDQQISLAIGNSYRSYVRQQNRFLGRALVISLVAWLRQRGLTKIEGTLKKELQLKQLYLDQYISAQYIMELENGEARSYSIKNGDIALVYSHGQDAFFTSLVVQPKLKKDRMLADQLNLFNRIFDARKFLSTSDYLKARDSQKTFRPITDKQSQSYDDFWNPEYANGFSHSGIAEVRRDSNSGISVAWIWDIYPEADQVGPVRVMSIEGFAPISKTLKVGFLSYDPQKVFAAFKRQIQNRGYLKNVWRGYGSFVGEYKSGKFGPSIDEEESYIWSTRVDQNTVSRWAKISFTEADSWYYEVIIPKVLGRIKEFAIGRDATVFASGLVSAKNMLYCSQMILIAFLEEINFDLQSEPDQIMTFLKYFSKEIKNVLKVNVHYRLVSPNGLVWQSEIYGNLMSYRLPHKLKYQKLNQLYAGNSPADQYFGFLEKQLKLDQINLISKENELIYLDPNEVSLDFESL